MRGRLAAMILMGLAMLGAVATPAYGEAGLTNFDVRIVDSEGQSSLEAGSHPFAFITSFEVKTKEAEGGIIPDEPVKDFFGLQMPGLVANPTAVQPCSTVDFLTHPPKGTEGLPFLSECADSSAVGYIKAKIGQPEGVMDIQSPIYNLEPPPGALAKLGTWIEGVPVSVELGLTDTYPYTGIAISRNITQILEFFGAEVLIWGNPIDPAHDPDRAACALIFIEGSCSADAPERPFLTLPRACEGPLTTSWEIDSWEKPGVWIKGAESTHDDVGNPRGMGGCGKLGFAPRINAQPTNHSAEGPSGMDVEFQIDDEGLTNSHGIADSDIKQAVVTLPEGMTANPSVAEGLSTCSPEQLAREKATSLAGAGCPAGSKLGTVEAQSPLLEGKTLKGALYIATPYDNPFNSLIALYITVKEPDLGVSVKLAGKVEPDPKTGQLITTFGDPSSSDPAFRNIPQLPVSRFRVHFREGGRSPLITPPTCGTYTTTAKLTPWANPQSSYVTSSDFSVIGGVNGGACPPGGTQPFEPGFAAGSINNSAGTYAPFFLRFTRRDGDQDLTRFDSIFPPGLTGKLAGVGKCSDAAIAAAKAKSGRQELASPSCPENSLIGHAEGGAGVGSQLTYVAGKIYLAGPIGGAPLSVVAIVPAVAGPFDVGTVVVRQALRINPRTAEVEVDGSVSDPIPHILAGIPLRVRDIQAHVDRQNFTLNPTGCERSQVRARLWGGGGNVFSVLDDSPLSRDVRFQAADCAHLGFKPRLSLALKGGTKRGDHPALHSIYTPRPGDANIAGLVLRLPRSAFLDQAHIRTICTRVQFAAKSCPAGAVYGKVKAFTPLLDEPLQGPVYLRSSDHNLPDLVFDLHGLVDFEAVLRIDSQKGGIRASLEGAPDAPISKVIVDMPSGKKGLIVNSTNLCAKGPHRANVQMSAHNGKRSSGKPEVKAKSCGTKRKRAKH